MERLFVALRAGTVGRECWEMLKHMRREQEFVIWVSIRSSFDRLRTNGYCFAIPLSYMWGCDR